jgi:hypothetical protein
MNYSKIVVHDVCLYPGVLGTCRYIPCDENAIHAIKNCHLLQENKKGMEVMRKRQS